MPHYGDNELWSICCMFQIVYSNGSSDYFEAFM